MATDTVRLKLLFADDGEFHSEEVDLPASGIDGYERLIDFLREDPDVLRNLHLDLGRLCSARRLDS